MGAIKKTIGFVFKAGLGLIVLGALAGVAAFVGVTNFFDKKIHPDKTPKSTGQEVTDTLERTRPSSGEAPQGSSPSESQTPTPRKPSSSPLEDILKKFGAKVAPKKYQPNATMQDVCKPGNKESWDDPKCKCAFDGYTPWDMLYDAAPESCDNGYNPN